MPCDNKASLKALQFALCVICLVYKIWTIWEERRVSLILQKKSLEWDWSRYTAAGDPTSLLSDITFGAYFLISGAFFIGRVFGDQTTKAETLLLLLGFVLFLLVGGILINCVDDVPDKLVVNTIILGVLSIVTGVLFLLDAGIRGSKRKPKTRPPLKQQTQKKDIVIVPSSSEERKEPVKVQAKPEYAEAKKRAEPQKEKNDNGISSVEIRIKEPAATDHARSRLADVDVIRHAERAEDYMHQTPKLVLPELEHEPVTFVTRERSGKYMPSMKASPIKHTSSYYVSNSQSPFAWKRLED